MKEQGAAHAFGGAAPLLGKNAEQQTQQQAFSKAKKKEQRINLKGGVKVRQVAEENCDT